MRIIFPEDDESADENQRSFHHSSSSELLLLLLLLMPQSPPRPAGPGGAGLRGGTHAAHATAAAAACGAAPLGEVFRGASATGTHTGILALSSATISVWPLLLAQMSAVLPALPCAAELAPHPIRLESVVPEFGL